MKYFSVGAATLAALLLATSAGAQIRLYSDPTTLVGPGASVGVRVRELSDDELKKTKLEATGGVYVEEVQRGSPAERAGLKAGDIVTEFDGERVRSVRGFQRLVSETPPKRTVKAAFVRDGSRKIIDVTPESAGDRLTRDFTRVMPAFPQNFPDLRVIPRAAPNLPRFDVTPPQRRLGLTLSTLGDQLAGYFGVSEGVLVSAVERDSPAACAGVKAGDVITAINRATVRRPSDVTDAVRNLSSGAALELTIMRDRKSMTLRVTPEGASAAGGSSRIPV